MKKISIIILGLFLSTQAYADTVSLTKEQFDNLPAVNDAIRNKYAQFKGMSGSQDKMEIFGISADSFKKELAKITFENQDKINSDKILNKASLIGKLKVLGLTDNEISLLGIRS